MNHQQICEKNNKQYHDYFRNNADNAVFKQLIDNCSKRDMRILFNEYVFMDIFETRKGRKVLIFEDIDVFKKSFLEASVTGDIKGETICKIRYKDYLIDLISLNINYFVLKPNVLTNAVITGKRNNKSDIQVYVRFLKRVDDSDKFEETNNIVGSVEFIRDADLFKYLSEDKLDSWKQYIDAQQ